MIVMLPFLRTTSPPLAPLSREDKELSSQLRRDIEVLATDIGPRGVFAPERYKIAEQFLESALKRAGYAVVRKTFDYLEVECCNLEAALPGTITPERILVVGAHYDSVEGCPAANDNASGVAGVLAAARALAGRRFRSTVRFVLFANEEPPHFNINAMGSQIYAYECHKKKEDIRGMICLETIGCYSSTPDSQIWPLEALRLVLPNTGNFIGIVGIEQSRRFIEACADAFERRQSFPMVAGAAPSSIEQASWSDHRGFNEAGYQALMVTDTAPLRYQHYHRSTDTPDKLDYESMARVVRGIIGSIEELADREDL